MKNRIFTFLLLIMLIIPFSFVFVACGQNGDGDDDGKTVFTYNTAKSMLENFGDNFTSTITASYDIKTTNNTASGDTTQNQTQTFNNIILKVDGNNSYIKIPEFIESYNVDGYTYTKDLKSNYSSVSNMITCNDILESMDIDVSGFDDILEYYKEIAKYSNNNYMELSDSQTASSISLKIDIAPFVSKLFTNIKTNKNQVFGNFINQFVKDMFKKEIDIKTLGNDLSLVLTEDFTYGDLFDLLEQKYAIDAEKFFDFCISTRKTLENIFEFNTQGLEINGFDVFSINDFEFSFDEISETKIVDFSSMGITLEEYKQELIDKCELYTNNEDFTLDVLLNQIFVENPSTIESVYFAVENITVPKLEFKLKFNFTNAQFVGVDYQLNGTLSIKSSETTSEEYVLNAKVSSLISETESTIVAVPLNFFPDSVCVTIHVEESQFVNNGYAVKFDVKGLSAFEIIEDEKIYATYNTVTKMLTLTEVAKKHLIGVNKIILTDFKYYVVIIIE